MNSSAGIFPAQQQKNLASLMQVSPNMQISNSLLTVTLQLIESVGFQRLFFRFATQGIAHPFSWKSWNQEQYLLCLRL